MKINRDDPRWTAYVLGELDDAGRAEIERLLESSEEAREFVEELQMASRMLSDEFAALGAQGLLPEQRSAVHAAAAPAPALRWLTPKAAWAAGLAAALMIVVGLSLSSTEPDGPDQPSLSAALESFEAPVYESRGAATAGAAQSPSVRNQADAASPGPASSDDAAIEMMKLLRDGSGGIPAERREAANEQDRPNAGAIPGVGLAPGGLPAPASFAGDGGGIGRQARLSQPAADTAPLPPPPGAPAQNFEAGRFVADSIRREPATQVERQIARIVSPEAPARRDRPGFQPNTESYNYIADNPFIRVGQNPLSTFSIDVDTASYANMRRFLMQNQMPPKDTIRIEELINYFTYDYPQPSRQHPIGAQMEAASAPWNPRHRLVRIGIKGRDMDAASRPSSNLVFLIDVSGSMAPAEKLPLLKSAMKLLVDRLTENDRVSIVVYAGASGTALRATTGDKKEIIMDVIDRLRSGGSTNGASGIQLAYELAVANFIRGGVNRVILATDGDFNVGVASQGELVRLIEEKARSGVFLSVFGFGMGNLKDSTLERLADSGNGNYAYIDTIHEARKVLVEEMGGTLVTIAKDVKIQVEFNPAHVGAYRLIGYENRLLRDEDFNNDLKDAGDMGAGHTVTALFEIVPAGVEIPVPGVDPLRYQAPPAAASVNRAPGANREMLNLKVRYKDPDGAESRLFEAALVDRGAGFLNASVDFRFAASVAAFGMLLRESPYRGDITMDAVLGMARQSLGADRGGYRGEFVELIRRARALSGQ